MRRREVLTLLAAAATFGAPALAQERLRRVGMLTAVPLADPESQARLAAFRRRLGERGWVEGRTIAFDIRSSQGDTAARPALAKELVATAPDVIVAASTADATVLMQATRTIPIVFATAADPVGTGLVQNLARPGGNVTGFTNVAPALGPKWLELLKDMAPTITRVAVLFNERTAPGGGAAFLDVLRAAAAPMGIDIVSLPVNEPSGFEAAIAPLGTAPAAGLLLLPDSFTVIHRRAIVALAAAHRVPAIYPFHYFADAGGLMSYGTDLESPSAQTADYVDLILKGANPGELPVQSPRKYMLWVNARAASDLGIDVPAILLARADRVIE